MRATISDGTNTATDEDTNGPSVGDGNWHHCVWVFDRSDKIFFYKDGVKTEGNSISSVTGSVTSSTYAALGKRPPADSGTGGSLYFDGEMRDVKIFPSALTAADIRKLYSGENPKKNTNAPAFSDLNGEEWSGASGGTAPTGWTEGNAGTFSVTAGELTITRNADNPYIYKTFTVTSGDAYKISYRLKNVNASHIRVGLGSTAIGTQLGITDHSATSYTTYEKIVTATSTTLSVYVQVSTSTAGQNGLIDFLRIESVGTLVDFTPQSASSSKWRNEALLGFYDGTVNNATLSQGNTYWNNIKQDGAAVKLLTSATIESASDAGLTLDRTGAGGQAQLAYKSQGVLKTQLTSNYGDGKFYLYHGGANALVAESNGDITINTKLGVGGVASDCKLRVVGTSEFENTIFLGDHQGYRGLISWSGDFDSGVGTAHHHLLLSGSNTAANAGIQFKTRAGSSNVDAGVISADGNWGIGHTAPNRTLHVKYVDTNTNIANSTVGKGLSIENSSNTLYTFASLEFRAHNADGRIGYQYVDNSKGSFFFRTDGVGDLLKLNSDGTHDHRGNRIVNSQTVSDSWRSSEPSLRFDNTATTNRVDVSGTLDLGYGDFTLVQWLKTEKHPSHSATNYSIFTSTNASDGRVWIQQTGGNSDTPSVVAYIRNSSGVTVGSLTISGKWQHGVWKHLALTCVRRGTGVGMKLYIDGVAVVSNTTDTSAVNVKNTGGGEFRIGNPSSTYQYGGEIKYTSVHNRAMEADEIKGLYNGESTPYKYTNSSNAELSTANFYNAFTGGNTDAATVTSTNSSQDQIAYKDQTFDGGKEFKVKFTVSDGESSSLFFNFRTATGGGGSNAGTIVSSTKGTATTSHVQLTETGDYEIIVNSLGSAASYRFVASASVGAINISNFSITQIGEVAAYTPQSINDKWYDTTSNANHGTITGATTVGDIDHFGILTVKGRRVAGDDDNNTAGCIKLGDTDSKMARIDYDPHSTSSLRIDNTHDHASAEIACGLRTSGTRIVPMQSLGDGTVKAGSSSGSLKQVARTGTSSSIGLINANGSATRFTIAHNLGTDLVIVSVREKLNDGTQGQRYAMVEANVRVGEWTDDTTMTPNSHFDKVTITFASAPHADADFLVTVIG